MHWLVLNTHFFLSVVLFLITNFLVYSSEGFNSSMHDSCIKITYCGLGYIVEPTSYTVLKLVSIGVLIASIVSWKLIPIHLFSTWNDWIAFTCAYTLHPLDRGDLKYYWTLFESIGYFHLHEVYLNFLCGTKQITTFNISLVVHGTVAEKSLPVSFHPFFFSCVIQYHFLFSLAYYW